jgi:hypothetical protein
MFGAPKTPKSQKPINLPLYFHRINDTEVQDYNLFWKQDYRQIATFDIGHKNLARRVSRRYFYPMIEPLVYDKTEVRIEADENNFQVLFSDIEKWLDEARETYLGCHVVIIEWQLPVNYQAVRISTFILSYFHFLLKDSPLLPFLVEMRSGFKDDYFPVLKPLNQNARKTKCEDIGIELLELQGDTWSLDILRSGKSRGRKKQDDYADPVIMEEVFARYASEHGYNFPHYGNGGQEKPLLTTSHKKVVVKKKDPAATKVVIVKKNHVPKNFQYTAKDVTA